MVKVETIKVSGGAEYAKVADRIKAFREDCPNGLINTSYVVEGGYITFKARAMKDKSKPHSAEGVGHARDKDKGNDKAFEKLETISIGRALAVLGYLASGVIASSEEMEAYHQEKAEKKQEEMLTFQAEISKIKTVEELRDFYMKNKGKGKEFDELIMNKKNQLTDIDGK